MKTSQTINEISSAISKAQSEIKTVEKDAENTFFKKPNGKGAAYATLDAIIEAVKKPLANHGLAVIQAPIEADGKLKLLTRLQHSSGEFFEFESPLILGKNDMQGLGAAITYQKRYSISALLNVATDEDLDGNDSIPAKETKASPKQASPKPAPASAPTSPGDANEKVMNYAQGLGVANQLEFNLLVIEKFGKPVNFNDKSSDECKAFCEWMKQKKTGG